MADDFKAVVARIRKEKGPDLETIAFDARTKMGGEAVSLSLIQKRLAPASTHAPTGPLLLTLATGLDESAADIFPEYRLLVARSHLDPETVGLDEALTHLDAIEAATRRSARSASRRAASPRDASQPLTQVDRPARPKQGRA